jgi:hypothetical protein
MKEETEQELEAKYDELNRQLDMLFPEAKFSICCIESLEDLDDVVDDKNNIIVLKMTHTCYCFDQNEDPARPPSKYFNVLRKRNCISITVRDCIEALIEQDCDPNCNHQFLEGFDITDSSSMQYELCFMS